MHRDELLFQTVHQSSELWLKHAWAEVEEATRLIEARDLARRAAAARAREPRAAATSTAFLEHLELMSPWEYQEVRRVLGHGSGFDSPGFRGDPAASRRGLYAAFDALRRERGLSLLEVYTQGREHEDLYQLAEALIDWDEQVGVWRFRHVKMVGRVIGEDVVGTQGTPVELLAGLIKHKMFPELWTVRTELTELAKESRLMIPLEEIRRARERIGDEVLRTPLVPFGTSGSGSSSSACSRSARSSCAARCRRCARRRAAELADGVVTASAGNMAQGVAWAAREVGVRRA